MPGAGAPLGILYVLDLTEKDLPPAATQNDLIVLAPKLDGFSAANATAPTRIVAAISHWSLRGLSAYSR